MDLMCDFWLSNQPMPRPSCQGGFSLIKGIRSEWGIPLFCIFWHEYDVIRGETKVIWKNTHFPSIFNQLKAFKTSKSAYLMFFGNTLYRHFWPIEMTLKLEIKVKLYSITPILSPPCPKSPKKDYLFWWPFCLKSENPPQKWHLQGMRGWDSLLLNCLIGNGLKCL